MTTEILKNVDAKIYTDNYTCRNIATTKKCKIFTVNNTNNYIYLCFKGKKQ